MRIGEIIDALEQAPRQGAEVDEPQGARYIVINTTLLDRILRRLRVAERREDVEVLSHAGYQPRDCGGGRGDPPRGGSGVPSGA